eukprot:497777_1
MSLSVYVRIRPLIPHQCNTSCISVKDQTIKIKTSPIPETYTFDGVFKSKSCNTTCFQDIMIPMIRHTLRGFSSIMIAYGQTSTGKTHTITGKPDANINGILQDTLSYLLQHHDKGWSKINDDKLNIQCDGQYARR